MPVPHLGFLRCLCLGCELGVRRQQEVAVDRRGKHTEKAHCAGLEGKGLEETRGEERLCDTHPHTYTHTVSIAIVLY